MELFLLNNKNEKVDFSFDDLRPGDDAFISVISGDEILTIQRADGSHEVYDSDYGSTRKMDFFDSIYSFYDDGHIQVDLSEWISRKEPDDYFC